MPLPLGLRCAVAGTSAPATSPKELYDSGSGSTLLPPREEPLPLREERVRPSSSLLSTAPGGVRCGNPSVRRPRRAGGVETEVESDGRRLLSSSV